jgi:hypothetical protein
MEPDGVFERVLGVEIDAGVLGRLGVVLDDDLACLMPEGVLVAVDLVDVPVFCGLRGCVLEGWRVELWSGERTGDFCGVLAAVDDLGAGALAGVDVAFRAGGDFVFTLDDLGACIGSAAGGGAASAAGGSATMMDGDVLGCDVGRGRIDGNIFDLSSVIVDTGGHSLFCKISSLAESPVVWDATLVLRGKLGGNRGGTIPDIDWRFCSKRPMRFATLWRGRSSGSGLEMAVVSCNM